MKNGKVYDPYALGHWRHEWGETCEAEAITPPVMDRIVREAIESRMDLDLLAQVKAREVGIRQRATGAIAPLLAEVMAEKEEAS